MFCGDLKVVFKQKKWATRLRPNHFDASSHLDRLTLSLSETKSASSTRKNALAQEQRVSKWQHSAARRILFCVLIFLLVENLSPFQLKTDRWQSSTRRLENRLGMASTIFLTTSHA